MGNMITDAFSSAARSAILGVLVVFAVCFGVYSLAEGNLDRPLRYLGQKIVAFEKNHKNGALEAKIGKVAIASGLKDLTRTLRDMKPFSRGGK
jgi:hypothetical protein